MSVSAGWRTRENAPRLENLEVTVTVAKAAEEMSEALVAALEDRVAARSLHALLPIRVRAE